jgi:hypothetical protein
MGFFRVTTAVCLVTPICLASGTGSERPPAIGFRLTSDTLVVALNVTVISAI